MKISLSCNWLITAVLWEDGGQGPAVSRGWRANQEEEPRAREQLVPAEASWVSRLYSWTAWLSILPQGCRTPKGKLVSQCPCISVSSSVE